MEPQGLMRLISMKELKSTDSVPPVTQAGQEHKPRQVASELASSFLPASSVRIWQGYGGEKDSTPR